MILRPVKAKDNIEKRKSFKK